MLTVTCCMKRSVEESGAGSLGAFLTARVGDRGFGASSLLEFSRRSLISSTKQSTIRPARALALYWDYDLVRVFYSLLMISSDRSWISSWLPSTSNWAPEWPSENFSPKSIELLLAENEFFFTLSALSDFYDRFFAFSNDFIFPATLDLTPE